MKDAKLMVESVDGELVFNFSPGDMTNDERVEFLRAASRYVSKQFEGLIVTTRTTGPGWSNVFDMPTVDRSGPSTFGGAL